MKTIHIGFSGTREGLDSRQLISLQGMLERPTKEYDECWLHHGLCRGGDAQAHNFAKALGYKIHGHPAIDRTYEQAGLFEQCDRLDPTFTYHGRNFRIVLACEYLIAAPLKASSHEGGTWWTINTARRIAKPRIILYRDGSVVKEEGN